MSPHFDNTYVVLVPEMLMSIDNVSVRFATDAGRIVCRKAVSWVWLGVVGCGRDGFDAGYGL